MFELNMSPFGSADICFDEASQYRTSHIPVQYHSCSHCGSMHAGQCPKVKAVEYHLDGTVKRVEYHETK